MLRRAADNYLALRRACGYKLTAAGFHLQSFAAFSRARDQHYVCAATAIEWAGLGSSVHARAGRLATVIRFTRHLRAEDPRHELPPPVYGSEQRPRPVPYTLSLENIRQLVAASAVQYGRHGALCGDTYSTLFSLLACTGLRVSEATALRYADITADGLVIRQTKFKKARLVPLHATARTGLEQYIGRRRLYAPFDDHLFISRRRKPLDLEDVDNAFKAAVTRIGLPSRGRPRPTPHSLRHFFAVQSLLACPDGRDRITQHMVALSTALGHTCVEKTYWYLEPTAELMSDIAARSENFFTAAQS
jgi:integrase/recombinase XerD